MPDDSANEFLRLHALNPDDNLNVAPLTRCPLTQRALRLNKDRDRLVNDAEGFYYPVVDTIPILIASERQSF